MRKTQKKLIALGIAGIMIVGSCFPSFAAGTTSKTVDGVKVTGSSSISGATAKGSTSRSTLGNSTVRINYRYKVKNSMSLKDGSKYTATGGYSSAVSDTPSDAEKMYEVSGTHTAALNSGTITIYT
ncbi:MAG: hypothetical protein K2O96_03465 [Lachnospiraceae bacterium]|nr:hypothetical protein [Lachnospiraceae bacterium]